MRLREFFGGGIWREVLVRGIVRFFLEEAENLPVLFFAFALIIGTAGRIRTFGLWFLGMFLRFLVG